MDFHKLLEIQKHAGAVYSVCKDADFLYSASADKYVARWNLSTGEQDSFSIKFENSIYAIATLSKYLFVGLSNGALHIFDLKKRLELKHYTQHKVAIFSIKVNALKNQFYVGDADGNLSVWSLSDFSLKLYLPLDAGKIRDIDVASSGKQIAIATQDGKLRVFDTATFNEVYTIDSHKDGATSVLFDKKDSNIIYSGGKDAYIRKWNLGSREMLKAIPAHNFAVYRLVSIKDVLISCSRDKNIKVWDLELNIIKRLDRKEGGHQHSVNDLIIYNKDSFVSCSDDKRIIHWQIDK